VLFIAIEQSMTGMIRWFCLLIFFLSMLTVSNMALLSLTDVEYTTFLTAFEALFYP